jgi:hypothetical protein
VSPGIEPFAFEPKVTLKIWRPSQPLPKYKVVPLPLFCLEVPERRVGMSSVRWQALLETERQAHVGSWGAVHVTWPPAEVVSCVVIDAVHEPAGDLAAQLREKRLRGVVHPLIEGGARAVVFTSQPVLTAEYEIVQEYVAACLHVRDYARRLPARLLPPVDLMDVRSGDSMQVVGTTGWDVVDVGAVLSAARREVFHRI